MSKCQICHGTGYYFHSLSGKYVLCNCCNGAGRVSKLKRPCPICNGHGNTGKISSGYGNVQLERCRYCNGTGTISETD